MKPVTLIVLLAAAAMHTALADPMLSGTAPADRAAVAAAPEKLDLRFTEAVRLTAVSLQRDGAAKQSLGPLPAATAHEFEVALPALADGHYTVSWRALHDDLHVMSGEFMFAVGATGGHDAHMNHH